MVEDKFDYPILKYGKLVIDFRFRKVTVVDQIVDLSTREFNLLYVLLLFTVE